MEMPEVGPGSECLRLDGSSIHQNRSPLRLAVDGLTSLMLNIPICSMVLVYENLQNWVIFRANVGKYTIHGAYGISNNDPHNCFLGF